MNASGVKLCVTLSPERPRFAFPVYEHLYLVNVSAQKLVDLLREISGRFGIDKEQSLYHQLLIQGVRSTISRQVVEHMARVEHVDAWQSDQRRDLEWLVRR